MINEAKKLHSRKRECTAVRTGINKWLTPDRCFCIMKSNSGRYA